MLGEYEIMIYLMAEFIASGPEFATMGSNGLKRPKGFHDQWSLRLIQKSFQIMRLRLSGLKTISDFYSKNNRSSIP